VVVGAVPNELDGFADRDVKERWHVTEDATGRCYENGVDLSP